MSRFDNKLCPICRRPLNDKSDVVVCPVCGTPHHRACYMAAGHCGVESYHAQGFEWKGWLPGEEPQTPEPAQSDEFSDSHRAEYPGQGAGMNGEQSAQYDQNAQNEQYGPPMDLGQYLEQLQRQTMDDTRGADGVSAKELSTFVGRSVMHYSQAFAAFRAPVQPGQKRRKIFINVCAGLFAPFHQFYRKMDLLGVVMLLIELLFYIPPILLNIGIGTREVLGDIQMFARGLSFVGMILVCLFGDYLYYRHAVKRIHQIRAKFDDGRAEGYYEALAAKGSPSWLRAIAASLAMSLVMAFVFLKLGIGIDSGTM